MTQLNKVQAQRKIVLEELKKNSSNEIFELLADILSIEREHKDNKHGVKDSIKSAIDRVADNVDSIER